MLFRQYMNNNRGDIMNAVDIYYKDIVEQESRKINNLKHTYGVVTEIVVPKNTGAAKVKVMGRTLRLLNKTGETLKVGDSVIIHYWDNMANGYIALRCGLPSLQQGLRIENAAVLDNDIKSLYTTSTTVFNEDEENNLTEKYSHAQNIVLVNEIPAIYVPTGATDETFKSIVKTIDKKLFSNRIQVKCHYNGRTGVRTIHGEVSAMKYVDLNTLGYFVGCYMEEDRNWYYNEESHAPFIYFTDTQVLENIGLVIAYQKIVTAASENFPYGYVTGNIVLRCGTNNDGYYDPGTGIVRRDMIHKLGTMDIGFKNQNEAKYALATTQRSELRVAR